MITKLVSLSALKVLSASLQLILSMSIAFYFGVSKDLDAYWITATFVSIFSFIFTEAQSKSFIPYISRLNNHNDVLNKTGQIITLNVMIFSVLSILVSIFSDSLVHMIAPGASRSLIVASGKMLKISAVMVLLLNLCGIIKGFLEYHNHFKTASFLDSFSPAISIVLLFLFHKKCSINILPVGAVIGQFIAFLTLVIILYSKFKVPINCRNVFSRESILYFKMMIPILLSASLFGLISLSETYISSYLDEGSLSSYSYAQRLVKNLPILIIPICSMYFPLFARMISDQKQELLQTTYNNGLKKLVFLSSTLTTYITASSELIVQILFQRGNFTQDDTTIVSSLIRYSSMMLFASPLGLYLINIYYAAGKMKLGAIISVLSSCINISCNFLFAYYWGLKGLAIGASIGYLTGNAIEYILIKSVLPQYKFRYSIVCIIPFAIPPIIGGAAAWTTLHFLLQTGPVTSDAILNLVYVTLVFVVGTYLGTLITGTSTKLRQLFQNF